MAQNALGEARRRGERLDRGTVTFTTATTVVATALENIKAVSADILNASADGRSVTYSVSGKNITFYQWQGGTGSPPAASTITLGASPATYTNADGVPEDIILTGGTVSSITYTRGGFTSAAIFTSTPAKIHLEPGDAITVTYSAAPTVQEKLLSSAGVAAASTGSITIAWVAVGTSTHGNSSLPNAD